MNTQWITHTLDAAATCPEKTGALGRDTLLQHEWLLTNSTGAYSMGTALACNTRRYHGLLVAATHPPVGRVVALNQVIDELVLADPASGATQRIELSNCLFRDDAGQPVFSPRGYEVLESFSRGLSAVWVYRWGEATVRRELILHHREQAITLRYRVTGLERLSSEASLRVSPMLTLRDFHGLAQRSESGGGFRVVVANDGKSVAVDHEGVAAVFASPQGRFVADKKIWQNVTYPRETYRGQGDREDYFLPGVFEFALRPSDSAAEVEITAALGKTPAVPRRESGRLTGLQFAADRLPGDEKLKHCLAIAADDFVVQRTIRGKKLSTIMAGYPWFADWGRDTFIALPGLLLSTGRHDDARDVLQVFAGAIHDGLVPNRFDDYDDSIAHYNTVDASLWFVQAGLQYSQASGQTPDWLIKAMRQIVDAYAAGTEAQTHDGGSVPIAMESDGLISAGNAQSQLTWMDAACDGVVFTPRHGKCVEINALWFNALVGLAGQLKTSAPRVAAGYAKRAAQVKTSFVKTFWSQRCQRLIDHVTPAGEVDASLRPNQVFACSLPNSPLTLPQQQAVLASVKEKLLTPVGLRTLPSDDPAYHARYGGPQFDRDKAYHQGTVWPWLIGPYAEGLLRTGKFSAQAKAEARAALQPLLDRLAGEGLGQLHEIFDATLGPTPGPTPEINPSVGLGFDESSSSPAHAPRGCIAQAWSVAEVLRVLTLMETK